MRARHSSTAALQIAHVVTVIALSPLLQGVILQWEEHVQRARGPGIFQPYRDLWKLFHSHSLCRTPSASWNCWTVPVVAFTYDLAGRVFRNKPAAQNLVPRYVFVSHSSVSMGQDEWGEA